MRYRLDTLLFLTAAAPPLIAAIYSDPAARLGILVGIALCVPVALLVVVTEVVAARRRSK